MFNNLEGVVHELTASVVFMKNLEPLPPWLLLLSQPLGSGRDGTGAQRIFVTYLDDLCVYTGKTLSSVGYFSLKKGQTFLFSPTLFSESIHLICSSDHPSQKLQKDTPESPYRAVRPLG